MDQVKSKTVKEKRKPRIATLWLGGCAGCHMSFLDLDEQLMELSDKISLVYGPLVDTKEFPQDVDVVLIEGAVANTDNLHHLRLARERSRLVVAFGDCAVTGNITSMRNMFGDTEAVTKRAYVENATIQQQIPQPDAILPTLLDKVVPLHQIVPVDVYLGGCPPSADLILFLVTELLAGRLPELKDKLKYG